MYSCWQCDNPRWLLQCFSGKNVDTWSIAVNANWRLTFKFIGQDAILVDYRDYH
ncbi:MAG: type II toxin-antitoxin system RelE/ParE family toxin [Treponema sp.]|nr:type II toxin-antitoxin system RelE/ParE family toxin [Treponema sp.]